MKLSLKSSSRVGEGAGIYFYVPKLQKILLLKRSPTVDYSGTWCGCGGGVDLNETPKRAAIREAFEELGFSSNVNLIPCGVLKSPVYDFYAYVGIVNDVFEPTLNEEHVEYGWFHVDELPDNLHPATIKIFEYIIEKGSLNG